VIQGKNMLKKIVVFVLFFCSNLAANATHIVGGELYYEFSGGNQYKITLIVYRDCYNGVPPFDDPAFIGVWDANNVLVTTINMASSNDSIEIENVINNPCFVRPVDVCYIKNKYEKTVTLPLIPGGYQLAYQRCCRNFSILNIVNPLNVGATFYCTIPGTPVINSNPVFTVLPPPFVCAGLPFVFDHSAIDSDGDSLVYEICTPYNGASQSVPVLDISSIGSFYPPFTTVIYQPPFNTANLLGGVPLTINPQTGLLTATPNTIGQFVIGICVNEYRNGVFLSKTRRDYQLNVVACPTLVVAALQTPVLTCGSNTVQFTNNSFGASTYLWNFGDPTTTADVSTAFSPAYTYPDTGTYTVSLIAYSAFNPLCADTTVGTVTLLPDYVVDFNYSLTPCSYVVNFTDSSNSVSGVTTEWLWNFGDGSPTSLVTDPVHTFPGPGTYVVTFRGKSLRGCIKTITKTIIIPPALTLSASSGSVTCSGLCTGQSAANIINGAAPYTFLWSDPLGQITSTATGLCPGTYTVTVTDSLGCIDSATATINSPVPLVSSTSSTDAYCNGLCIGTATISGSGGTPPLSVVWNDPQSQTTLSATGLCPGTYIAILTDINGCSVSNNATVTFSNFIPPLEAIISDSTIYIGESVNLLANTTGNFTYSWTPVSGISNPTIQNPTANPVINTTYYVTITDSSGCSNLDSVSVVVREVSCVEPEIFIPNAFTPNGDNNNDKVYVRGNTIKELEFKIFDRWGEKVFETNDPKIGWDGYYKGEIANPAVYVYYVEAVCFNNEKFFKKGNITLIR